VAGVGVGQSVRRRISCPQGRSSRNASTAVLDGGRLVKRADDAGSLNRLATKPPAGLPAARPAPRSRLQPPPAPPRHRERPLVASTTAADHRPGRNRPPDARTRWRRSSPPSRDTAWPALRPRTPRPTPGLGESGGWSDGEPIVTPTTSCDQDDPRELGWHTEPARLGLKGPTLCYTTELSYSDTRCPRLVRSVTGSAWQAVWQLLLGGQGT
jgi:hypothetical protein